MDDIWLDLLNIGYAYFVFLMAYVSNMLFSLYFNIKVKGDDFNRFLLLESFKKATIFVLATFFLVISVEISLIYFGNYIPELSKTLNNLVNIVMVVSTIGRAAIKYIVEAYNTFAKVLNDKNKIDNIELMEYMEPVLQKKYYNILKKKEV